ncbi:MAG: glucose-6-phosphate isomerase [Bordetella sp.]|uniref:glucose-6-phosphate isomerase n=1 Tax=Bordetella sp. TaxID=28081 RepID=UPI003F7C56F3
MSSDLPSSPAWQQFAAAARGAALDGAALRIIEAAGLQVDLTTQRHGAALDQAGAALLAQQGFEQTRAGLFAGEPINWTEHRAAWHTALRASQPPAAVAGPVLGERRHVRQFVADADARGAWKHVLHLGIGGSDWGPRMIVRALGDKGLRRIIRFAANVDAHDILQQLADLDPAQTLVIVASKTFTTTESLANAQVALDWLREAGIADPFSHLAAVTANPQAARDFGVADERIFRFWDWVGGRYSLWSAIHLPIALALGNEAVDELLAGAEAMDQHFLAAPIAANAPVQMALAAVANRSVLGYPTQAIAPYDARMAFLVPWAQQLEMESLGKSVTADGTPAGVPTSPVVWGLTGTDSQHTFFQWMHQDAQGTPVDFIACREPDHGYERNHRILLANCLAQRAALLTGKSYEEALSETQRTESDPAQAALLARHRVHPGGRPSTLIVLPRLTARTLGSLLALYEHKVFTQGVLWGINTFDQWGVEFGKVLAKRIIGELDAADGGAGAWKDASTRHWIGLLSKQ